MYDMRKIVIDQYFYNSEFSEFFSLEKALNWSIYPLIWSKNGS